MGHGRSGMPGGVFAAWVAGFVAVVALQSAVHVALALHAHRIDTPFDLNRSNGLPDLASTASLIGATAGAVTLARGSSVRDGTARALGVVLGVLTFADLVHGGPHLSSELGRVTVAVSVAAGVLLAVLAVRFCTRERVTVVVAGCLLAASFVVSGLDRIDQWFERRRGDPIAEYQIVAKEGLELLGWSLVALALWGHALLSTATAEARTRDDTDMPVPD